MWHSRTLCASGCTGGTATLTWQEYVLSFKRGRQTVTKMGTALKNLSSAMLQQISMKF